MKGSFSLASWGCSEKETRDIIEQAKEELQILEVQQPNRFNYLKLELKSFISFLESQNLILSGNKCEKMLAWAIDSTFVSVSSTATTQGKSIHCGLSGSDVILRSWQNLFQAVEVEDAPDAVLDHKLVSSCDERNAMSCLGPPSNLQLFRATAWKAIQMALIVTFTLKIHGTGQPEAHLFSNSK